MNEKEHPKLLILNQMAGPMTWELAEDLSKYLGCVAVLTGHPDTLAKGSRPGLQLHPSVEYVKGSMLRRINCWLRYCIHAFFWLWKWPGKTPVIVFSNPPFGPWVVWAISRLRGTPYAVMVHDVYPDVAERLGMIKRDSILSKLWRRGNRIAYNRASSVMTLGKYMATVVGEQFNCEQIPTGKVAVIPPWADCEKISPIPKEENSFAIEHNQVDKLTVMYSGNMGNGHDIETMLQAAERLKEHAEIHFLFIGMGPKWKLAESTQREKELHNVSVLPWQKESEIPFTLTTADVAFVSLEAEMAGLAIPSKAYYSLAAGSSIIVICGQDTEISDLVINNHCGARINPGDVDALVAVLRKLAEERQLLKQWKQNARQTGMELANRKTCLRILDELIQSKTLTRCAKTELVVDTRFSSKESRAV